jgi:hypothetical protein
LSLELLVEAALDRALRDCKGERVGRKLVGVAAKHVARELVEQDHPGERGQRMSRKIGPEAARFSSHRSRKPIADFLVELGSCRATIAPARARTRI